MTKIEKAFTKSLNAFDLLIASPARFLPYWKKYNIGSRASCSVCSVFKNKCGKCPMRHITKNKLRCISNNYLFFQYFMDHCLDNDTFGDFDKLVVYARRRRNEIIKAIKKEGYDYE